MKYYMEEVGTVFSHISSSENGLSAEEAQLRLDKNGKNKLEEGKKKTLLKRFFEQLSDPMIIILIVAAVVSAFTALYEHEFPSDTLIILIVVLINAILGVFQESKAEKAIEALQEMASATSKVLRDGKVMQIKSEDIVTGDVVLLEAGDSVPADCRLFESASLKIEEASLTGESVPVGKIISILNGGDNDEVSLGDRKNMAYMGSTVEYGRGKGVVIGTGMDTEMGKIADAISKTQDGQTPLQLKLSQLSKILTVIVLIICVFIFGFSIFMDRGVFSAGDSSVIFSSVLEYFMIAVSLAVAAIPEGLAAVVTVVLSIGVTNMSRKNAIIRKLTAVETLGCAQIICSDKTGTLTQNKMTVTVHYGDDENLLAGAMALCTDAEIDDNGEVTGEATEAALVHYAYSLGMSKNDLKLRYPRIGEAPFDSGRKLMSTVHSNGDGFIQYTKGAPDEILKICTHIRINGEITELTDTRRAEILAQNKAFADKALRVLACSYKEYSSAPDSFEPSVLENSLIFIGLTGMIDPVRPEVKAAIMECESAGIRPIMITGDHRDTAVAIALELGIITDASQAITGAELDKITDDEFKQKVQEYSVYARVQPEHKTRIVNAWRALGMVVAMTGDGVNDAPSIKSADIGVGMGITGTDVTKNVADMVLADDNFATIVSAVSEGRRIYDNIRKSIQFLLGSNLAEVLAIFVATLLGFTILKPVHLLFINLITDCFPALALGLEKPEPDVMGRKPRSSSEGIFSGGLGSDVLYQGILVTGFTLLAYFIGNLMSFNELYASGLISQELFASAGDFVATFFAIESESMKAALSAISMDGAPVFANAYEYIHANGMTMAFLTMSICEIFHSFNMRSQRNSVLRMGVQGSHNKWLYFAMLGSFVVTAAIIEIPPLARLFDLATIDISEYAVSITLAFCIIPIVEIVKAVQRAVNKRSEAK